MNRRVPFDVWYLIFEVLTHRDPNNICKWMRVNKTFNRVLTSWQQNTVNKLQERLANMKRLLADAIDKQQTTVSFDGKTNHYVKNIPQAEFRDVVVLMLKDSFCSYCYRCTWRLPVVLCGMVHYCVDCVFQNLNQILILRTVHRSYRARMAEMIGIIV
jgi:hypothetical protein